MNQFRAVRTAAVAAILLTVPSFAQSRESDVGSHSNELCKSYNRVGVSYTNTMLWSGSDNSLFIKDAKNSVFLNGFALEYIHGFNLKSKLPLFIETGVEFNAGFGAQKVSTVTVDTKDVKKRFQKIYVAVPVNLAYKIGAGSGVSIVPYIGLNFKLNIMGRAKTVSVPDVVIRPDGTPVVVRPDGTFAPVSVGELVSDWETLYPGDGKSAFGEKYHYQIGWHVGVGVDIKRVYLGVNYGTDFTNAFIDVHEGNFVATVGYCF